MGESTIWKTEHSGGVAQLITDALLKQCDAARCIQLALERRGLLVQIREASFVLLYRACALKVAAGPSTSETDFWHLYWLFAIDRQPSLQCQCPAERLILAAVLRRG